jgi:hypothetical protein
LADHAEAIQQRGVIRRSLAQTAAAPQPFAAESA